MGSNFESMIKSACEASQNLRNGVGVKKAIFNNKARHNHISILPNGIIQVIYHNTLIAVINPKARNIKLENDNWFTPTTKERMNAVLHQISFELTCPLWFIYQDKGLWYFSSSCYKGKITIPYFNGMLINLDTGKVLNSEIMPPNQKEAQKFKMKLINEYINKVKKMISNDTLPKQATGDCLMCLFKDEKTGKPFMHGEHLEGHLIEKYVMYSLIANAIQENSMNPQLRLEFLFYNLKSHADIIGRDLRKYFSKHVNADRLLEMYKEFQKNGEL